jgi:hypothetical protein
MLAVAEWETQSKFGACGMGNADQDGRRSMSPIPNDAYETTAKSWISQKKLATLSLISCFINRWTGLFQHIANGVHRRNLSPQGRSGLPENWFRSVWRSSFFDNHDIKGLKICAKREIPALKSAPIIRNGEGGYDWANFTVPNISLIALAGHTRDPSCFKASWQPLITFQYCEKAGRFLSRMPDKPNK